MYTELLKAAPKHLLGKRGTSQEPICEREKRLMQLRVEAYNQRIGTLTGYDCPKCRNRGNYAKIVNGEEVIVRCECREIRDAMNRIIESGLKDMLNRYSFENYQAEQPWQGKIKRGAQKYAENPSGWFYLGGTVGCGKTHICTAICDRLMEQKIPVLYMLWREKATELKALVNEPEYEKKILRYKTADCLYIDDFLKAGREKVTDADLNLAFEILNARYNNESLLTILSSERSIEDIMNLDAAIGSRIYQRSKENYYYVSGQDKNWRLK